MHYIADLTKCHPGTEGPVLEGLLQARPQQSDDTLEVLLLSSQEEPKAPGIDFTSLEAGGGSEDSQVSAHVLRAITEFRQAETAVAVASFRPAVKKVAEAIEAAFGDVEYIYLNQFSPPSGNGSAVESYSWDDDFMPRDEAVDALVRALNRAKIPVRMTQLRKSLQAHDARFQKAAGSFSSRPRFLSVLISLAEERGLVAHRESLLGDGNNFIELTERGLAYVAEKESGTSYAQSVPPSAAIAEGESRSDQFITTLRKASLGPFQEVRWAVYEEIDKLAQAGECSAAFLIRDAVSYVRDHKASELVKTNKPFPWARVRTFISNLASMAPVFISRGELVQNLLLQGDRQVDELSPKWKLVLDGELLCFLLAQGIEITTDDIPALAGALYNSRRDEAYDRTLEMIGCLVQSNRITTAGIHPPRLVLKAAG
ncbi:hypothetical protein [Streptomyces sp. NBC_00986]|uniref:hypothetical protein n=1 Tax=Streptomyces sp. NBC_00986 TaxID=2903702 RepID=UPI00386D60BB|nr:hypothetical protein OG504_33640 [Streptomyces sp. NBC_00986]